MGMLLVRCPATGKEIASGVEIDLQSLEKTPAFTGSIHCPFCGIEHAWSKIDARIGEGEPPVAA
jgi:hypothetical protein